MNSECEYWVNVVKSNVSASFPCIPKFVSSCSPAYVKAVKVMASLSTQIPEECVPKVSEEALTLARSIDECKSVEDYANRLSSEPFLRELREVQARTDLKDYKKWKKDYFKDLKKRYRELTPSELEALIEALEFRLEEITGTKARQGRT
ncbi:hypothetical protein [Sulfodiicoccus acidiphilus]|nr:hypothetical protein [Sulfodiicoccus acidiphilus]